jgi:ubiquinone/menaquinone biosynthesis C-methylase UbiE
MASEQRIKIVPQAEGNVLEIGVGSGLNLPYYNGKMVKSLIAVDPHPAVWEMRKTDSDTLPFHFEYRNEFAENLPFENRTFDTIVITYSMCTIGDVLTSLQQMRRVLKDNGKILFSEHGKAPEKAVAVFQNNLNPIWRPLAGGCNLNRDIPQLLKDSGFAFRHFEEGYISSLKFGSYNYLGIAEKR